MVSGNIVYNSNKYLNSIIDKRNDNIKSDIKINNTNINYTKTLNKELK
jgi:hypothetical protein